MWSDGEDALGVVAQAGDGPADEAAGGLGGDAEALADLAEALALAVEQAEAGLDRVAARSSSVPSSSSSSSLSTIAITASSGVPSPLAMRSPSVASPSSPTVLSSDTGVVRRCSSAFVGVERLAVAARPGAARRAGWPNGRRGCG